MKWLVYIRFILPLLLLVWSVDTYAQAPGCPNVDAGLDQNLTCSNNCVNLTANLFQTGLTTDYTVSSVAYAPPFGFTGGTQLFINLDDIWSPALSMPFNFCFYGNMYNQIVVGTNGVLTFDLTNASGFCSWQVIAPIPTPGPPPIGIYNNSINGVFHDINPATSNPASNINYSILGTAPCRSLVVNFYKVEHYNCSGMISTSQIVLYETTNVIEVYVDSKPICALWNDGRAVIGLQNSTGTQGITPPGRNTGIWSTGGEAWQFTPSGLSNTSINWYDQNMNLISNNLTVNVCPLVNTTYTAEGIYDRCDGTQVIVQDQVAINVAGGFTTTQSFTNEICLGSCDGTISISALSGTPPYTYDLGTGSQANGNFTGLCNGLYSVTISDAGGCTGTQSFTILPSTQITVNEAVTNEICFTANDGAVTLTASVGTAPYTYDIGYGPSNNTGSFTNLPPNSYSYTVTDANGCPATGSFILSPGPVCCVMTNTIAFTDPSCSLSCDGTITLTQNLGAFPVQYSIDNGQNFQWTGNFNSLCAGTYDIVMIDDWNCQYNDQVVLTDPPILTINSIITDVSCNGYSDGIIDITVSGGTSPYTYNWSTNATTQDISGLIISSYTVTVTDANNCTISNSFTINQPLVLTVQGATTNVSCNGYSNGAVYLLVNGGTTPYTFNWTNNANTQNITGITNGTYSVTVTDANSCSYSNSYTITQPTAISITGNATNTSCFGTSDGSIDINVNGGFLPYTFNWSNNSSNEDLFSLTVGTYTVTITDGNNCTLTNSYTVNTPTALTIQNIITDVSCFGASDGAIDINVNGGTLPYTFNWSNNSNSEDISGIAVGTYTVTVSDANSCTITNSFTINTPAALTIQNITTHISCFGFSDGAIDININGGTSPYTFNWSNNATTEDISGITTGNYTVTVTDANSCTLSGSFTINTPTALNTQAFTTDASCNGVSDGAIDITVTGGTTPYTFNWSNNAITEDLSGIAAGNYTVTITDANSCILTNSFNIIEPTAINIQGTTTDISCNGLSDGAVDITITGGSLPYTFNWSNNTNTEDISGVVVGTYTVTVTDANTCTLSSSFTINTPTILSIQATTSDISCNGLTDGVIDITITGGTLPYTFNWSNNATTEDISGLDIGTYTVTVTDANTCTLSSSFTINTPTALNIQSLYNDVSCNGVSDGAIDITVSGGTLPYTFNWSNNTNNEDISIITAGTYTVTVTDANSCTITNSFTINTPTALVIQDIITNASCNGLSDGGIDITITGGTLPYTFNWSNNANTEDISNIAAGNYTITVTDANTCTLTNSFTIVEPATLNSQIATADVSCNGFSNGIIDLTVTGGTLPYTFNWSNSSNNEDLFAIVAGIYSVTITDANNCTISNSATIFEPGALSLQGTTLDANCNGVSNGAIDITITGGTLPYTFNWSNNAITEDISGIAAGTYTVSVVDANNCSISNLFTIFEPTMLAIQSASTVVSCSGGSDGLIDITVSGGVTPYTFNWSNNAITEDISNLTIGTYTVTVTDANNCILSNTTTIIENTPVTVTPTITNVSCANLNDGVINISTSGGIAPYTYSWSNNANTEDITGLVDGNYTISVWDANSCLYSNTFTVTEPAPLVIQDVISNVSCSGFSDGAIDLTVSGGTTPYTFNWTNNVTTEDISGLTAGNYIVTVTDANFCTKYNFYSVTEPPPLTIQGITTNVSCNGFTDGAIDITITGGTLPYTFNWSDNSITEDIAGIIAGTYTVTITDANNCTISSLFNINEPQIINLQNTITNVSCNGLTDGLIDITITGGTLPYTFIWSTNASTEDITGIAAGNYSVTVADANNCSLINSFTIVEPIVLNSQIATADVSCFGFSNGVIDLTVTGGTTPYTFNWSNNATSEDLFAIVAGNYTVTVTDANTCTISNSISITEPAALSLQGTTIDASCNGQLNGSVDITISGGTLPYTFNWSNNAITEDITGIAAGTYSVTIIDANNCSIANSFIVNTPSSLAIQGSITDVTCNGLSNGAIDITITGGTLPYTFNWSNNAITEDITSITAGNYLVTVSDANNCSLINSFTIVEPAVLNIQSATADVSCYGFSDGVIDLTVTGGTSPYTFNWSNNTTSEDLFAIVADNYTVTVTDANNCTISNSITITEPVALSLQGTTIDASCNGQLNGSVDITISGGTLPYTFNWSNNAITEDITGVAAGTYSVTIIDANNCSISNSFIINTPSSLAIQGLIIVVTCNGLSNGAIDITITGGTLPYTFNWSNNAITEDITSITAGNYLVTVSDANNCSLMNSFNIVEPAVLNTQSATADVSCFGFSNGVIDLTVTGGTTPYTFNWSNNSISEDLFAIVAGIYSVTVTDANTCTISNSITITEPVALSLQSTTVDASCNGQLDGAIDITISGGTLPYTFNWSNIAITEDITGVAAGTYSVTIIDANNCSISNSFIINTPSSLAIQNITTDVTCNGLSNGAIDISITGGTLPYTFNWSNNVITEDITSITAGNYTVTVADANNCSLSNSFTIIEPLALNIQSATTDVSCYGFSDGVIDLTVTGGTSPYTFNWSNNSTSEDLFAIVAGSYTVTVTDANTCTISNSITITEPVTLSLQGITTDASCNGQLDGAIDITIMGGTLPYTFNWSNNAITEDIAGIAAGTYFVTINDANSCSISNSFTINEPTTLTLQSSITPVTCSGFSNGEIDITINGGTLPYTFNWSNNQTTEDIIGVLVGTYTVTVNDANGCTISNSFAISEPIKLTLLSNVTNLNCNNISNGAIDLTVSGGTLPYTYVWSTGAFTEDISSIPAGSYTVTIKDAHGCSLFNTFSITQPTPLAIQNTTVDVSCNGFSDGAIDITVSGGTLPYSFVWSNNAITEDISGITVGTYTVTITDAGNCTLSNSITIIEPTAIAIQANSTNVSCNGGTDGIIDITANGGIAPYTYNWSNNAITEDISNISVGIYTVTVTDANNCILTNTTTIIENSPVSVTSTITDVSCNGYNDGLIDITSSGGLLPYTFNWSNNAITEDISTLIAGSYTISVWDANSCLLSNTYTVSQPIALTIQGATANVSCNGFSNGVIDITVSGGTFPYTFNWSNNSNSEDLFAVVAGAYTVTVTDANTCTNSNSYTITEPSALTIQGITTDASCSGLSDGAIDISITGGTLPYTYNWSNNAVTEDISGIAAGIYSVTVVDANNCSLSNSYTINEPLTINLQSIVTDVSCNGGSDGIIDITANGGTSPYTFIWSGGQTSEDIANLTIGTYTITVTDANNCSATNSTTIIEPSLVSLSSAVTNVSCNGFSDAIINISVTGGTFPYTYNWSTGETTQDIANLPIGTYTLSVLDANSCPSNISVPITQPMPIILNDAITNTTCFGSTDGAIDISPSGGTLPYSYSWSNNTTTQDINLIAAGSYTITLTDLNNCILSNTYTITEPVVLSVQEIITDASCSGFTDGAIDISPTGGTSPYTYNWSNNATTQNITGLIAANYTLTIIDNNNCSLNNTYTVNTPVTLSIPGITTNTTCNGFADGAIDVSPSGGTLPYTFNWSNNAITEDISGIVAGVYTVTMADVNGCSFSNTFTITQPTPITSQGVITTVSCNGLSDGAIDITLTGGTLPYTYNWSNNQVSEDISGILAGAYTITVTDANNCTLSNTYTVIEPLVLSEQSTTTNISCYGFSDGIIDVTITGGNLPYTYIWSNNAITNNISGIIVGAYTITVTDANNCTLSNSYSLTEPPALGVLGLTTDVSCNGYSDGIIDISVSGGTIPYKYIWSNNAVTEDISNLSVGTYSVSVSDANNCNFNDSYTITQPNPITIQANPIDVSCGGLSDATIDITTSGGTPPYTFNWSTNETTEDISNLAVGNYIITITDGKSCTTSQTIGITEPLALALTSEIQNSSCNNNNGRIFLNITGGSLPYSFNWSNGNNNQDITQLFEGNYTVTITDANNCVVLSDFDILNSPELIIDAGDNDTIRIYDTTGLEPYFSNPEIVQSVYWSPNNTLNCEGCEEPIAFPLYTTTYTLEVEDEFGCRYSDDVVIVVYSNPIIYVPNVFTPNGDGKNDEFAIMGQEIKSVYLQIFDRWGELLFETNDKNIGWNGTFNGALMNPGVYVYRAQIINFTNGIETRTGSITLLR